MEGGRQGVILLIDAYFAEMMTVPVTYLQCAQFNSIVQSAVKLSGVNPGEQLGLLGCLVFLLVLRAVTAGGREGRVIFWGV